MRLTYKKQEIDISRMYQILDETCDSKLDSSSILSLLDNVLEPIRSQKKNQKLTASNSTKDTQPSLPLLIHAIKLGHLNGVKALIDLSQKDKDFDLQIPKQLEFSIKGHNTLFSTLAYSIYLYKQAKKLQPLDEKEDHDTKAKIPKENRKNIIFLLLDKFTFENIDGMSYKESTTSIASAICLAAETDDLELFNKIQNGCNKCIAIYDRQSRTHRSPFLTAITSRSFKIFLKLCSLLRYTSDENSEYRNKTESILLPDKLESNKWFQNYTLDLWKNFISKIFEAINSIADVNDRKEMLSNFITALYLKIMPNHTDLFITQTVLANFTKTIELKKPELVSSFLSVIIDILKTIEPRSNTEFRRPLIRWSPPVTVPCNLGYLLHQHFTFPAIESLGDNDQTRSMMIETLMAGLENEFIYDLIPKSYIDLMFQENNFKTIALIFWNYHVKKSVVNNKFTDSDASKDNSKKHYEESELQKKIVALPLPSFTQVFNSLKNSPRNFGDDFLLIVIKRLAMHLNWECLNFAVKELILNLNTSERRSFVPKLEKVTTSFLEVYSNLANVNQNNTEPVILIRKFMEISNDKNQTSQIDKLTTMQGEISQNSSILSSEQKGSDDLQEPPPPYPTNEVSSSVSSTHAASAPSHTDIKAHDMSRNSSPTAENPPSIAPTPLNPEATSFQIPPAPERTPSPFDLDKTKPEEVLSSNNGVTLRSFTQTPTDTFDQPDREINDLLAEYNAAKEDVEQTGSEYLTVLKGEYIKTLFQPTSPDHQLVDQHLQTLAKDSCLSDQTKGAIQTLLNLSKPISDNLSGLRPKPVADQQKPHRKSKKSHAKQHPQTIMWRPKGTGNSVDINLQTPTVVAAPANDKTPQPASDLSQEHKPNSLN